ncbi:TPA: hCG1990491-like [Bos taurus]|nr:TPA: hCG1990491-like [Bos taurus]
MGPGGHFENLESEKKSTWAIPKRSSRGSCYQETSTYFFMFFSLRTFSNLHHYSDLAKINTNSYQGSEKVKKDIREKIALFRAQHPDLVPNPEKSGVPQRSEMKVPEKLQENVQTVKSPPEKSLPMKWKFHGEPKKPPMNGYHKFHQDLWSSRELKVVPRREHMVEISRCWQQVPQDQKELYKKQAEGLQTQYKVDLDLWLRTLPPEEYAAYREVTCVKRKNMSVTGGLNPKIRRMGQWRCTRYKVGPRAAPSTSCSGSVRLLCGPCLLGQTVLTHSLSGRRRHGAQDHLSLSPGLPEATGTAQLLWTPHIIHRLSKLSQLEASGSLTSDYTSDQESRVLTLKQKCRSRRQDRNRRENPHTYEAKILPRNVGSELCDHADLASLPEPQNECPSASSPAPPWEGPTAAGRSPLTTRTAPAQTPVTGFS